MNVSLSLPDRSAGAPATTVRRRRSERAGLNSQSIAVESVANDR